MKVFVSGPMSGLPGNNFANFNRAARYLANEGYDVVNPADTGTVEGWEWTDYMRLSLQQLLDCDAVAYLEGWEDSDGASLEISVAESLDMPCKPWWEWE